MSTADRRNGAQQNGPRVSDLYIYPVKGLRGVRVDSMELDDFGPRHDRRWMIVGADGVFVSQRELSSMALVHASMDGDIVALTGSDRPSLRVPRPDGSRVRVRIWNDVVDAIDAGDEAAAWLTDAFGRPLRLVHMPDDSVRPVHAAFGGERDRVSFADAFPFLIISQAALDALNERLATPLPMNRFRPNIVVDGVAAHAEDGWKRISLGEVELELVKPCARCAVTTVDQDTGVRGVEPLRTLAEYRKVGSHVMFGQNAIHRSRGTLRVGAAVQILDQR